MSHFAHTGCTMVLSQGSIRAEVGLASLEVRRAKREMADVTNLDSPQGASLMRHLLPFFGTDSYIGVGKVDRLTVHRLHALMCGEIDFALQMVDGSEFTGKCVLSTLSVGEELPSGMEVRFALNTTGPVTAKAAQPAGRLTEHKGLARYVEVGKSPAKAAALARASEELLKDSTWDPSQAYMPIAAVNSVSFAGTDGQLHTLKPGEFMPAVSDELPTLEDLPGAGDFDLVESAL